MRRRRVKMGRPQADRDLVIRNMKLKDNFGRPRYTDRQLADMAGCSKRTIRRIREEAIEMGLLDSDEVSQARALGVVEADLDLECERAIGYKFTDWLYTRFKNKSQAKTVFNYTAEIWETLWDKCSLVEMADMSSQLADQNAIKFVNHINDERGSSRANLKKIRFIFRFLNRKDIADKNLRMDNTKNPRSKRRVPEISQIEFGQKWQEIEDLVVKELGEVARLMMRFKICTQMRTGDKKDEREFYGIRKGSESRSYLFMESADRYQSTIFAKKSEEWSLLWLPKWVKDNLWEHYQTIPRGETLWSISDVRFRRALGKASRKVLGRTLILHDLRKISLTWLYACGVPLEVCVMMNVGWKDLSTAFRHYIEVKNFLRGSVRLEYASNIPEWFKEGLDDFIGHDAMINNQGLGMTQAQAMQGVGYFGQ